MKKLLLGLALLLAGCQSHVVSYNKELADGKDWVQLFEKRLHRKVVVVMVHGDVDLHDGKWFTCADDFANRMPVDELAQKTRDKYPFHAIAMICCNTHKMVLHVRGVWYCRWFNSTWDIPGEEWVFRKKTGQWEVAGGRFEDFEEGRP